VPQRAEVGNEAELAEDLDLPAVEKRQEIPIEV
jgi:hypothetical protein